MRVGTYFKILYQLYRKEGRKEKRISDVKILIVKSDEEL
jgi:hypothetical protein